jgi:trehalose 6-phosphate synthase
LKNRNPSLVVAQFWHIPWPNRETFRAFPWKEDLLDGLLGNDLLGFHLRYHCQNFLDTVDRAIEARVDQERYEVTLRGKVTAVRPFPISIDFAEHASAAAGAAVDGEMAHWRRALDLGAMRIGLGIDRIDYTKGIPERLCSLDRFLERCPEYRGKLVFIQIGVPSRLRAPEYKKLGEEIEALVSQINAKWSSGAWRPILFLKTHLGPVQMMALHRLADFCMVSSLHDGMNLVAKEYAASRFDENGMLILSEFTGAARELTDAILVNPFDLDSCAEAIRRALEMAPEERRKRMRRMRAVVADNNVYRWAAKILAALARIEAPQAVLPMMDAAGQPNGEQLCASATASARPAGT